MNSPLIMGALASGCLLFGFGCGDSSGSGGGGGEGTTTGGSTSQTTTAGSTTSTTTGATSGSTSTGGQQAATVELSISPATVAAGGSVTGTITVSNFVLDPPGGANEDGHGHFHIYLDGNSGGSYLIAGQNVTTNIPIPANTAPGAHTLHITLSDNAHVPLNPVVEDFVDITIE